MTCGRLREFLFAFLDDELDGPSSIEVQRHIDHCHHCAQEIEIERGVRRELVVTLERGANSPPFDAEAILATIGQAVSYRPRLLRFGHAKRAGSIAAVLVVAAAALFSWLKSGTESRGTFADLVVADFAHFLEEGSEVQVASSETRIVADWLRAKTALAVALPMPLDSGWRLVGGRKCKIDGQIAAFAVYDLEGVPASLVAVRVEHAALGGMEVVGGADGLRWVARRGGYTVVAHRRGELVYAVVSRLPEEKLLPFTVNVRKDEGN